MRIRIALAGVAATAGLAAVVTPAAVREPDPAAAPVAAVTSPGLGVLRAWDTRRAQAWAGGDAAALRRLYPPGSVAGAADVGLLRRYLARGLVVSGMRRQLLAVRVVHASERRVVVRLTDRLVGATAVPATGSGTGTGEATTLPASAPATRRLDLRLCVGEWQLVSVRRVARL